MKKKINIRPIKDEEYLSFCELYYEMNNILDSKVKMASAVFSLSQDMAFKPNFLALGLFEEETLVGFCCGYSVSDVTFYFSGLYSKIKSVSNIHLLKHSLEFSKKSGFLFWEADVGVTNTRTIKILNSLKAQKQSIKYTGDL